MKTATAQILLHAALVLFICTAWFLFDPITVLFVGGVASFLVYCYLTCVEITSCQNVLTPLSFHFLWSSTATGIAASYFALVVWREGFAGFDTIPYVTGQNLAAGFLICLFRSFVLHLILRRIAPESARCMSLQRIVHPIFGIVLFVVGIYVIIAPPGLMILGGLPASLFRYAPVAILLAIAFGPRTRRGFWVKVLTGSAILAAANLLAFFPYKTGVLESLFPTLVALWRYSRKLAIAIACFVPLFYLGVVAPYVAASRNKADTNPLERLSSPAVADDSGEVRKLMGRVFEPISVGFIVAQTRHGDFLYGKTMKNVVYAFVPRLLWPEKPDMNTGKWFTMYLGYASQAQDANTSSAMTSAGELYWNFAIPGVILGTIIQYSLYGYLWVLAEKFGKSTLAGALLLMISVTSVNAGDFSGSLIVGLGIYALLALVLLWSNAKKMLAWLFHEPEGAALANFQKRGEGIADA